MLNDEQLSTSIIKATNNQTAVQKISLRAMEPVHFDIESKLRVNGLFYDRRKGKYRQLNDNNFTISKVMNCLWKINFNTNPNNVWGNGNSIVFLSTC